MRMICFVIGLLQVFNASAQGETKTVQTEQKISDVFSFKDIYCFDKFTPGKVLFKDGSTADALMNYNRLYEQLLFIDGRGDTLTLAAPELVEVVSIDKDSFYYGKDFFMQLELSAGGVKVASRQLLKEIDKKELSAYGSVSSAASSTSFRREYTRDGSPIKMKPGEGMLFSKNTEFFIADRFNHFEPLTKKTLENAFRQEQKAVKDFIKANDIDLKKQEDISKLFAYMVSLAK